MAPTGTASPELLVPGLDRGRPLRAQLEGALREGVRSGRLRPGARLPSTRVLAADLRVSRRLVVEAYAQLVAEGYLKSRGGSGTRVRTTLTTSAGSGEGRSAVERWPAGTSRPTPGSEPRVDLMPGTPDLARFPRRAWANAHRAVLAELPDRRLGYAGTRGAPELRAALADHLGRVRGAAVDHPGRIVVTGGYTQGLRLLLEALRDRGVRRVGVEDPGYPFNASLIAAAGLESVPVRADADGLDPEALAAEDPNAVILTPAHGLPLGGVLAPERRTALVAWAREHGALIIEDDYDAEIRYDADPVGTVQGLAPDVVALVGTVSKTLAPALRLGWVLAPGRLASELAALRAAHDLGSPTLEQLTLARLISSGGLDRHVRRLRPHYRARRDAVLAALAEQLPRARVHGVAAGLHVLVELPARTDEAATVLAARREGVAVYGLSLYCAGPPPFPGLVLGYAAHTPHELTRAVAVIARAT